MMRERMQIRVICAPPAPVERELSRRQSRRSASMERAGVGAIISQGWGSSGRTDTHLTYMIDIALTTEFVLPPRGAW